MGSAPRIRKQVYKLTVKDLEQYPLWEFALDEEGEPGQDEATVRPVLDKAALSEPGMFVVRTRFKAADGTEYVGLCTPAPAADLGTVQPSIVTPNGHASFWGGMFGWKPGTIEKAYGLLGRRGTALFPIRYSLDVAMPKSLPGGVIPGFQSYTSPGDKRIVTIM